jgi:glycosidase
MPLLKRVLAGLVAVSFCGFAVAQTTPVRGKVAPAAVPQAMSDCATQQGSSPCIDKIDPPNWWSNMPGPMLLLHGDHFNSAHFFVRGQNVAITRTRVSTNGHWAFLWLDTKNAAPQMLTVEATSSSGHIKENFELKQRKPASAGFKGFSPNDVIYLIMTDRFADGDPSNDNIGGNDGGRAAPRGWHGGDFKGIEDHLDYLQQLGVTTLWLTPITSNAGMKDSYHGYGATDLYATDPHFGSVQDYQHLVEALHGRGMKIVMDTVPNHVGIAIPWVNDPPAPDWFHGTLAQHSIAKSPFRYLADPHAAPLNKADITEGWFTDSLPDLNQENPLVAKYLIQNTIWWIETAGIDGLREDTFPYVGRRFWSEFHQQIHELYPRMTEVGEVYTPDPTIASYFAGGRKHNEVDTGLSTPFDYPLQFTLRAALTQDKPMTAIEETLGNDWLYPHPESLVTFFGNHDLKRFLSEPGASIAKLKVAFGLIATLRGTPEIYSGDEIAMQGGNDPDNRRDFPGGFPGDKTSAFTPAGRTPEQQQVYAWMQGLLHLRAKEPALTQGEQQNIFADDTAFAFVRGTNLSTGCASGNKRLLVIAGKNADARYLSVTTTQTSLEGCAHYVRLYPAEQIPVHTTRSTVSLDLPASGFVIYRATP